MVTWLFLRVSAAVRCRWKELRRRLVSDAGYTTETIVVTAILVVVAITVGGTIAYKAIDRGENMDLEAEYEGP